MIEELWQKTRRLIPLKRIPSSKYILIAILILGFLIRSYKISALPLYGDELTMVYDAYSVLLTGMDQTGESYPLTFKMGAGRPPGYIYGSLPFVSLFGPSAWGVRGLSVFSGLGIILLMYFLGKKIFNPKVGIIASFLTSISLWDIYLSRGGFEAHFALFLALFGIIMFLHKKFIGMAFFFGATIFTYPTFKLTLPLLFLTLIIFNGVKETLKNKSFVLCLVILSIFAFFNLRETFYNVSEVRFLSINIFADSTVRENIVQKINESRGLSTLPNFIKPLIYNKPLAYSRIILDDYVENLSPRFLFLRGDGNPRHNPGEWGMLYLVEIILLFVGLYHLFGESKKSFYLLCAWILIVPLATMLIGETHALRNNLMLPPFLLISAYALENVSKKMLFISLIFIGIQLTSVLITIYFYAPYKFGSFWSEEARSTSFFAMREDKTKNVVISNRIDNLEYAYPVYAKVDPRLVISQYGKFPKVYGNVMITAE